jgi:hypothetical protein
MINDPNSNLMMSSNGKRFITLNDNYVIIDGDKISIINHVYSYDIFIQGKALHNLISNFNIRLDKDREALELEIFTNVQNSLDSVMSKIKKDIKKKKEKY